MTSLAFEFDYHAEERDGFWHWVVEAMITPLHEDGRWKSVMADSDSGRKFVLTAQLNGHEVSPQAFFNSMFMNYQHSVARGVADAIRELGVGALQETLEDVQRAAVATMRARAAELGLKLPDEDSY